MARLLGHRQTKGAATDQPNLMPPRHISTLPELGRIGDRLKSAPRLTELPRIQEDALMNQNLSLSLAPIVSLLAGILILVMPRLLHYIVAIYLSVFCAACRTD